MSVATINRLGQNYQVTRHVEGSWAGGKYVQGAAQTFTIRAVIVPTTPQQLLMLPEGEREKDYIRIFTADEIHTADPAGNQTADHIFYRGRDYMIARDSFWDGKSKYYELLAVRV